MKEKKYYETENQAFIKPQVTISVTNLDIEIEEGKVYKNSFLVISENQVPVRGHVFSTNDKLGVDKAEISGVKTEIKYYFKGKLSVAGSEFEGDFVILTNGGEFNIPYRIRVVPKSAETSVGRISSMEEFARLYAQYPREAMELFFLSSFPEVFLKHDPEKRALYHSLMKSRSKPLILEEFMTAAGYKEQISIETEEKSIFLNEGEESGKLVLKLSGPGYLEGRIFTERNQVRLSAERFSSEDFHENTLEDIEELGDEHEKTGKVIVYTSSDSVFQIAANTDVVPLEELYRICRIARELLVGEYACGRVIARPYIKGPDGKRVRTADRHDYALSPPEDTILDVISKAGMTVYSIGKIRDIFNGKGITEAVHTESNDDGVTKTIEALNKDFDGLIFTNLVDFDSKYGHRRDPVGYGKAIEEFDRRLPEIMESLRDDDILIITADHGNDPTHIDFNHTREYVFCLMCGKSLRKGVDLGTRKTFADIGATAADYLIGKKKPAEIGESFLELIKA